MDDYPRQSQHQNWHSVQDNSLRNLEQTVRTLEMKIGTLESSHYLTQNSITAIEKVIGTQDNYRFVEKPDYDDHDPF